MRRAEPHVVSRRNRPTIRVHRCSGLPAALSQVDGRGRAESRRGQRVGHSVQASEGPLNSKRTGSDVALGPTPGRRASAAQLSSTASGAFLGKVVMELLVAVSSSYRIGEYTGMVLLLVALVYCIARAFHILPRASTTATGRTLVSIPTQPTSQVSSSVAPPGVSPPSAAFTHQPIPVSPASRPSVRWSYLVAAFVLAVVLVVGVLRTTHANSGPWDTATGAQVKTGFIDGCTQSGQSAARCGCLFSQLTAQPAYSTPAGFESLAITMRKFLSTHDPRWLPDNYQAIVAACRSVA